MHFFKILSGLIVGLLAFSASCKRSVVQPDGKKPKQTETRDHDTPQTYRLDSFEAAPFWKTLNPFSGARVVEAHSTHGEKALRIDRNYAEINTPLHDWRDFDYLVADVYVEGDTPVDLYVEIHDAKTTGYWTRVNYWTVALPGKTRLTLPLKQLYVGEKSRPGRPLFLEQITELFIGLGKTHGLSLFLDNVRLARDTETEKYVFDGLRAYDFGLENSPVMSGFEKVLSSTQYTRERGFGFIDAKIWRSFDVLQPDPLYQDFICVEAGEFAMDLPNGRYRVFINLDNPSGYWGEFQRYRTRRVLAEGQPVVSQTMTFEDFKQKYFRYWDVDDLPRDDTFEKYQVPYYEAKMFEVEVADGQLNLGFEGADFACSVCAIVVFPAAKRTLGDAFLRYVTTRRQRAFDNAFKRVLHQPSGAYTPNKQDRARGYVVFSRDYMKDVFYDDRPTPDECNPTLAGAGFQGEREPLTFSILPINALGNVSVSLSDLLGPGTIAKENISVGYVSYRLKRKTMEGSVYTIAPRFVVPKSHVEIEAGTTRRFWLTIDIPTDAEPGTYRGAVTVAPQNGQATTVPVAFVVHKGSLDSLDVPAGPWGYRIDLQWFEDEKETTDWNRAMARKSLLTLKKNGFTSFSGMPTLRYRGFEHGRPVIDFDVADTEMKMARDAGFDMPIVNYTRIEGLDVYTVDRDAVNAAGIRDYSVFIEKVFGAIERHATRAHWLPVYYNIGDEPVEADLNKAIENADAYRKAFPTGPPFFTAATSFSSNDKEDGHFSFAKRLHVANLSGHNEKSVRLLRDSGGHWAFYNEGRRFTFGIYMFKAKQQFDMKFRLNWHWNNAAGNPYYALDCREDDYAWANAAPDGELMMSVEFEREMREGIDDYRYLLTLHRLATSKKDRAALLAISKWLDTFQLGDFDKAIDWRAFRKEMAEHIERLRR